MRKYDSENDYNYQYLAEVWYSKFGTILTQGSVDFCFVDPNYSSFSKSLLTGYVITRPTLNEMIEEYIDYDSKAEGLRGVMYDVNQLNYALDMIKEYCFYIMVKREEETSRKYDVAIAAIKAEIRHEKGLTG